ncbi:hypothetical protein N2152v2_005856 [Parachlorella kessleri]
MSGRPDPITKAANAASPGVPRSIRARTGQTTDPVPEGFQESSSPTHHLPVEPAEHDVDRTKLKAAEEMGVSDQQLASFKGNSDMETEEKAKELVHRNMTEEMRHRANKAEQQAQKEGTRSSANKQMDSRSGPRPS